MTSKSPSQKTLPEGAYSESAWMAVVKAYTALPEQGKKAILEYVHHGDRDMFDYLVNNADLPGGFDVRKVCARKGSYGPKIDTAPQTLRGGLPLKHAVEGFLNAKGLIHQACKDCRGSFDRAVAEQELDAYREARFSDNIYGGLLVAFLKCFSPLEPSAPDASPKRNAPQTGKNQAILSKVDAPDQKPQKSATTIQEATAMGTMKQSEDRSSLEESLGRLDKDAAQIAAWAAQVRCAQPLDSVTMTEAIKQTAVDITRFIELFATRTREAGIQVESWTTRQELDARIEQIESVMKQKAESGKTAEFLQDLAGSIRKIVVQHRSKFERERQSKLQMEAAEEAETMAAKDPPKWIGQGPCDGEQWLAWAFALEDADLDHVQQALSENEFPQMAAFIGVGDPDWIPTDPDTSTDKPSSQPCVETSGATSRSPQKESASAQVAPESVAPTSIDLPVDDATKTVAEVPQEAEVHQTDPEASQAPATNTEETKKAAESEAIVGDPSLPPHSAKVKTDGAHGQESAPCADHPAGEPSSLAHSTPPQEPDVSLAIPEWDGADATTIARRALEAQGSDNRLNHISHLAWQWLAEGEVGLALQLVRSVEEKNTSVWMPPTWLLEMLMLKDWVSMEQYKIWACIREIATTHADHPVPGGIPRELEKANRLLVATAAMRPALLSPSIDFARMLRLVGASQEGRFWNIVSTIADFADDCTPLSKQIIMETVGEVEWQKQANERREEKTRKLAEFRVAKLNYAPATQVLAAWLHPGGFLDSVFTRIGSEDRNFCNQLREQLNHVDIVSKIDWTYETVLKKQSRIEGLARRTLIKRAEEVLALGREWIQLMDSRGSEHVSPVRQLYLKLKHDVEEAAEEVGRELGTQSVSTSRCSFFDRTATTLAKKEFENLRRVLRGEVWPDEGCCEPETVLNQDLLRFPDWDTTEGATGENQKLINKMLVRTVSNQLSYEHAFDELSKMGRHDQTSKLLDAVRASGYSADVLDKLTSARSESVASWISRIRSNIAEMERKLNDAIGKGLMSASVFGTHIATLHHQLNVLDKASRDGDDSIDFGEIQKKLDVITKNLEATKEEEIRNVESRLATTTIPDAGVEARIRQIIASGDMILAHDYLDRVGRGESLPPSDEPETRNAFVEFFGEGRGNGGVYNGILQFLSKEPFPASDLIANVRTGSANRLLGDFGPEHEPDSSFAEALSSWFEISRTKNVQITSDKIASILRGIGFSLQESVVRGHNSRVPSFSVQCHEPLPSRLPKFGSETHGRFTVLCLRGFSGVEQMFEQISVPDGEMRGLLVFLFGSMREHDRAALVQASMNRSRNILVLDTVLMVHLASAGNQRLRTFFECTIPFTNVQPYNFTANPLPPEMFYGRRREIEAIITASPNGSCIVYGGRQIGKTVLLTEVLRRFHNPAQQHVALHIDLKVKQIGTQRDASELWNVLVIELLSSIPELEENQQKIPKKITYEWFKNRVKTWLDKNLERRILLLLDEADAFLESDGQGTPPFAECDKLRELMKESNLCFKAVLAGLHNVQRTTRVANQPLVHFGEALCIGPLLNNGEARQAYKLVTEPLASLGISFENPDLPNSILARTNYYPNLIQIYCKALLDHVRNRWSSLGGGNGAPYYITAGDLDEVYERQDLKQELRSKFKLSLDLDRRFRLIANVLAYKAEEHPEGMTVQAIYDQVMDFWRLGFCVDGDANRPLPHDSFKQLLHEMVGLGMLRLSSDEFLFSLRSPNVLLLLGTREEIESDILASMRWELPPVYTPTTFHNQIITNSRHDNNEPKRHPLTAEQAAQIEAEASTVHVVLGSPAAGLDALPEALGFRRGDPLPFIQVPDDISSEDRFISFLQSSSRNRALGKTVLFVPSDQGWIASWVKSARQYLKSLSKEDAHIGVVFACSPAKLWALRASWHDVEAAAKAVLVLHPWHDDAVRSWLTEGSFGEQTREMRQSIREKTGNWYLQLMQMPRPNRKNLSRILEAMGANEPAEATETIRSFGIVECVPEQLLRFIAKYSDLKLSTEDICEFAEADSPLANLESIREAAWWAEKLDFIYRSDQGWEVDGFLKRMLGFVRADRDGH